MRTPRIFIGALALVAVIAGVTYWAGRGSGSSTYEAEAGRLAYGARIVACERCSNGSRVTGLGEVTFTGVLSDEDGPVKIQVAYSAVADRTVRVSANDGAPTVLALPGTRGADRISTARVTLVLKPGENWITFTGQGGPAPDLDQITLAASTGHPPITTTVVPTAIPPANASQAPPDKRATEVVKLVNAERAKAGCEPVTADPQLTAAALAHSADMAKRNYFGPTGPDGKDFATRITEAGFRWSAVAENIAKGEPTPAAAMATWTKNPAYKANIVNCTYLSVGVGVAAGPKGVLLWTQDFARASSAG